jgi:GT2 family glycosyltransferase
MRPAASVVVPALPGDETAAGCLRALQAQTVRDRLQLVLSLDGEGESEAAGRADLVVTGPHAGPAAARNRGWRASAGGIILFTDADCVPEPDWAERLMEAILEGADAAKGVYSHGGRRVVQRLAQVEFEERYGLLGRGETVDMVDTYSAGYRREALESVGGFDETFPVPDHEDVDLSYRLAERGFRMVFAPGARVGHIHPATWSAYARLKLSRGRWRARVLRRFPSRASGDGYTPLAMRLQMLLAGLLPAAVAAVPAAPAAVAAAYAGLWLISSLPLSALAARRDPGVAPLVPLFCAVRGFALAGGLAAGIVREAACSRR